MVLNLILTIEDQYNQDDMCVGDTFEFKSLALSWVKRTVTSIDADGYVRTVDANGQANGAYPDIYRNSGRNFARVGQEGVVYLNREEVFRTKLNYSHTQQQEEETADAFAAALKRALVLGAR